VNPKGNMAENKKDETKDNNITPSEDTTKDTSKKVSELSKEEKAWTKIVGGKFKTEDELAQAYKDLEGKLGTQGDELGQLREFANLTQPLLAVIQDDPELFKKIDEKLKGQSDTSKSKPSGDEKAISQDEIRTTASDLVINRFEEKYGIDKLPTDEREKLRRAIGDEVRELTGAGFNAVDLRRLPAILEKAYILANKDKLIEKSKLEALVSAKGLEEAGIGSLPSSPGKGAETLTPEEAKVADKMGLTREQYLEGKKKSGK